MGDITTRIPRVITEDMLSRDVLTAHDLTELPDDMRGTEDNPGGYWAGESVLTKFTSVGALIAWTWSGISDQDADCGNSEFGNGWHARFDSERVFLQTVSGGEVRAWRIADDEDMDAKWAEIEAEACDSEGRPWLGCGEDCDDTCMCDGEE